MNNENPFLPGELDNLVLVEIKTLPDGSTKEVYAIVE
jgi:hypothetical protein